MTACGACSFISPFLVASGLWPEPLLPSGETPHPQILRPFRHVPAFFVFQIQSFKSQITAPRILNVRNGSRPQLFHEYRNAKLLALLHAAANPFHIARPRIRPGLAAEDGPANCGVRPAARGLRGARSAECGIA